MFRRLVIALVTVCVVSAMGVTPHSAQGSAITGLSAWDNGAGTNRIDGRVTKKEWRRAKPGMAIAKVHRIFNTKGRQVDYWPELDWQARTYRPWRDDIYLLVDYVKKDGVWRLDSKSVDRDCGPCY